MFSAPNTVVFVDDDDVLRFAIGQSLELAGLKVLPFSAPAKALKAIDATFAGVVVTDIRMPQMDGNQFFERLRTLDAEIPVILITGHADVSEAVQAMHEGAYDFVAKPFTNERLIHSVERALEKRRLVMDNRRLLAIAQEAQAGWPMIGESAAIEAFRSVLRGAAAADVDILIEGETGVGKELAARALHNWGPRRERSFVTVNCGALPAAMVESELFGHELGAFPGAVRKRIGRIESADRGTLFLDEIDSMPAEAQVKLLRFLEEREIAPLGTNDVHTVDVRVIAAARVDAARTGRISPELYHRLNVVSVAVPPLRERQGDVAILFAHFLTRAAERFGREAPPLDAAARRTLREHDWPGNVRELAHFAERQVLALGVNHSQPEGAGLGSLKRLLGKYEAELIVEALTVNEGDIQRTVDILEIPKKTFYDKVNRHGIDIDRFRPAKV